MTVQGELEVDFACLAVEAAWRIVAPNLPAARIVDRPDWIAAATESMRVMMNGAEKPRGFLTGRVTGAQAKEALDAARAGVVATAGLRGRSSIPPAEQAAEVAVRELLGPVAPDVLRTGSDGAAGPRHPRVKRSPQRTIRPLLSPTWARTITYMRACA